MFLKLNTSTSLKTLKFRSSTKMTLRTLTMDCTRFKSTITSRLSQVGLALTERHANSVEKNIKTTVTSSFLILRRN